MQEEKEAGANIGYPILDKGSSWMVQIGRRKVGNFTLTKKLGKLPTSTRSA